jgi:DNA mismatch repair protein MutL
MMGAFRPGADRLRAMPDRPTGIAAYDPSFRAASTANYDPSALAVPAARHAGFGESSTDALRRRTGNERADSRAGAVRAPDEALLRTELGAARAQMHENYIVSQTRDSLDHRRPACRP